jgi:hypothetical protein
MQRTSIQESTERPLRVLMGRLPTPASPAMSLPRTPSAGDASRRVLMALLATHQCPVMTQALRLRCSCCPVMRQTTRNPVAMAAQEARPVCPLHSSTIPTTAARG